MINIAKVISHHKVNRLYNSSDELLRECLGLMSSEGLVVEFGVGGGGTISLIADYIKPRIVYGFDWFRGLPEDWDENNGKGKFDRNGEAPKLPDNVVIIKGLVEDTAREFFDRERKPIAFAHMDLDLYWPTSYALLALIPYIVDGTILNFNEFFGYPAYREHEAKAFSEFLRFANMKYEIIGTSGSSYCQAAFRLKSKVICERLDARL